MKNIKNTLRYWFYLLLVIIFYSCANSTDYKPESMNKYKGWVIVQKPYSNPLIDNYIRYSLEVYKDGVGKKVFVYEYYYRFYELGDTVKSCYR